jgi:hypothetical protein
MTSWVWAYFEVNEIQGRVRCALNPRSFLAWERVLREVTLSCEFCRCTADMGNPTKEKCHHVLNQPKGGSTANLITHLSSSHGINKYSSNATKTGLAQPQLTFRRGEPWQVTKVICVHSPPNA